MARSRHAVRHALALATASIVLLGACSNDPKPKTATVTAPSSSSTTDPSTSTTQPSDLEPQRPRLIYVRSLAPAKRDIAEAYLHAVVAYIRSSQDPDPWAPALARTHVGPMLQAIRARETELASRGQAIRLPTPTRFTIRIDGLSIDGSFAVLRVCEVDDGVVYRRASGRVIDGAIVSQRRRVTMQKSGARWRLAGRTSETKQSGAGACRS